MSHDNINNSSPIDLPNGNPNEGIIRIHSDSQQSLDRLFNTSNGETTVPLRNRNLPASFFNPSWQAEKDGQLPNNPHQRSNPVSLHSRSTSFEPGRNLPSRPQTSAHFRTRSTLTPIQPTLPRNYYSSSNQEAQNPIAPVSQLPSGPAFNSVVNPHGADVVHNLYHDMATVEPMTDTSYTSPSHQQWVNPASLHTRSTSFEPGRNLSSQLHTSTHFRTQSTVAPSQVTAPHDYYPTNNHESQTSIPPVSQLQSSSTFSTIVNSPDVDDKNNLYYDMGSNDTMTETNFIPPNQQQRSNPVSLHTRSTNFTPGRNSSSQLHTSTQFTTQQTLAPSQVTVSQDYYSTDNHEVQTSIPPAPQPHSVPSFNAPINSQGVDVKHNLYYDMEIVSTIADTNYTLNSAWLAG